MFRSTISLMRALALVLALLVGPASAQMPLTGAGGTKVAAASYQGPGDIISGASAYYSCSRVYNLASANTSTNMCDLVDSAAPTTVICTLRGSSTGFVDLSAYCAGGLTPAAKCAAATGGKCFVYQAYDQTGNGRIMTEATQANQPFLTFNAINGLPVMDCTGIASCLMQTGALVAWVQPMTLAGVFKRTANFTTAGGVIGINSIVQGIGVAAVANTGEIAAGTAVTFAGATDSVWHSLTGLMNGAACAYNLDGTDTAGVNCGTTTGTNTLRLFRVLNQLSGQIAEAIVYNNTSTTATQRGNLFTNQNSSNGYNGAL